jgi:tRNA1Val (adenine37-N6)-methyltransferase
LGQSFFHFKSFSVQQKLAGLKVTTDACVLGALASHPQPLNILDIGTGTGILSLMMAQKFPQANIQAFEIEPTAAEQAFYNFEHSIFMQQITLNREDFLKSAPTLYDLIICNPPYFKKHLRGSSEVKNSAIHNTSLPFDQLVHKIYGSLAVDGLAWIILPPQEMLDFKKEAENTGLCAMETTQVYNKPGKHFRTVTCFSKALINPISVTELILSDAQGARSHQFSLLMRDFYLENTTIYKRSSPDSE